MDEPIKMIYGMSSTRVDDDLVEEVMDSLDDIIEDEWDILAWRRTASTRFVIRASVKCRAIQSDSELGIKVVPLGRVLDDMRDPRNEWVVPRKVAKGTPFDSAQRNAEKWSASLWPESVQEVVKKAKDGELQDTEPEEEQITEQEKPRISVVKTNPKDEVLAAFGLTGDETSEDGIPFGLMSYTEIDSSKE